LCLLVAAAPSVLRAQDEDDDDYRSKVDTTFAFDKTGSVSLSLHEGEIIVRAWSRPQVQIRAYSEHSTIHLDASSMRVSLDLGRERGGDSHFEVTVPEGARVSAQTISGDITITGTKGSVDAQTQSGDIEVEDAADIIDISSVSGDVRANTLRGSVEARAVSGDVDLADVQGDIEGNSVSGDIQIRGAVSKYVRAKSTSGDVMYDGNIDTAGRYELGSHSGEVEISIPEGTSATFTVATYNGTIDSDFPITLQPGDHGLGNSKRFTFSIGHGDARVNAESFSGDITIRSTRHSSVRNPNR
jgi:DUF4097 and DUF4098 domain-containing protein YvlB